MKAIAEGVDGTSFTDDGIDSGGTYYYQVIAESDMGDSEPSQELEVVIGSTGLLIVLIAAIVLVVFVLIFMRVRGRR